MIDDWNKISPVLFEKICASVLKNVGFTNIQWYGETGNDKGRDIIAEKLDSPVPGISRSEHWMIQCKRYTKKSFSKSELKDLLDSALEHSIDSLLIIITSTVSANLRDWMTNAILKYPFKAYIWEDLDFRREIINNKQNLLDEIPEISEGKEPIWMYQRSHSQIHLGCNEFEEIEIVVQNTDNPEKAKEQAFEFLKHIQKNGFEWWD